MPIDCTKLPDASGIHVNSSGRVRSSLYLLLLLLLLTTIYEQSSLHAEMSATGQAENMDVTATQTQPWSETINEYRLELGARMNNDTIVKHLRQAKILTPDEKDEFDVERPGRKKNGRLVDILMQKTEADFFKFLNILRSDEVGLKDIADRMDPRL